MNVVITDAGRFFSKRPKQVNDCTVRAYAKAFDLEYDAAYEKLAAAGRKSGRKFRVEVFLEKEGLVKQSYPSVKGKKRMNVGTFIDEHPSGCYIVKVAKHVFTVIDGVIYDDFSIDPSKTVYSSWAIK